MITATIKVLPSGESAFPCTGGKISVIKAVRVATGFGIREAKDAVEAGIIHVDDMAFRKLVDLAPAAGGEIGLAGVPVDAPRRVSRKTPRSMRLAMYRVACWSGALGETSRQGRGSREVDYFAVERCEQMAQAMLAAEKR